VPRILHLTMTLLLLCSMGSIASQQHREGDSPREWTSKKQPKTKNRNKKNQHQHHHLSLRADANKLT
jgi:uncharacterized MAPEG superfamily protein